MSIIAIITARGGSKRIPKKNIRDFCGKPIIAYSIQAALDSNIFDEVMVSTDSEEIADVAKKYGAKVPFMRSEKTSDDFATTQDVLEEVIAEYSKMGREFEYFACLYPTAPFITAKKLQDAYNVFTKENAHQLTSVVKFSFPPQRAFVIRDGYLKYQYPEYASARSQDLEPIYHDSGQFYFYETKAFKNKTGINCEKTIAYILKETEVQDIDTIEDWIIAEEKMSRILIDSNVVNSK